VLTTGAARCFGVVNICIFVVNKYAKKIKTMSMKGEMYKGKKAMMMHEKMEGKKEMEMEYGKAAAKKKMAKSKSKSKAKSKKK
jgi:hypothetical protein